MSAIEITRQDLSISQLRAEAARTADAKQARRILAIAMVLDEHPRLLAAQAGGMDRQTLRDLVHRYNADGLAGLADRPRPGRQPRLAEAQLSEVAKWVEDGPDPKTDGVVRWRCADLGDRIAAKFNIHLHERSVGWISAASRCVLCTRRPTLRRRRLLKKLRQAGTRRDPAAACRPAG